jgi:hypothetical protein
MAQPAPPAGSTSSRPKCPICRKPVSHDFRPFCSPRCRDVDLARWLGGGYVIGGPALDVADESPPLDSPPHGPGVSSEDDGED